MFLDEIEKDEIELLNKYKKIAVHYIKNFFDTQYSETIKGKIFNVPIIMIKNDDFTTGNKSPKLCFNQNMFYNNIKQNLSKKQKSLLYRDYKMFLEYKEACGICSTSFLRTKKNVFTNIILKDFNNLFQSTFIHEFLHLISLKTYDVEKKNSYYNHYCVYKSGFETCIVEKSKYNIVFHKIKKRQLNEAFTDYMAHKIVANMEKDDVKLFKNLFLDSCYTDWFVLLTPLFEKHFNTLKHCYLSNSVENIETIFGKENLKELNILLKNFSDYANIFYEKKYHTPKTFNEGLEKSKIMNENLIINKYYNCFKQMNGLMKKINSQMKKNNFLEGYKKCF